MRKFLLTTSCLVLFAGCDLSPDYTLPKVAGDDHFKEATSADSANKTPAVAAPTLAPEDDLKWKRVDEKAKIEEFAWWRMFNAPALDALEEQALKDSPSLEVAAQRVEGARAAADISRSALFPTVSVGVGPQRQRPAAANVNANIPAGFNVQTKPYTTYTAQGAITYELDLFGKNRNTMRAATFDAQAEQNNYLAARLALQADIAQAYFERAALLMEDEILAKTIKARQESRAITLRKREVGEVDDLELSTQDTDLANAQSDRAAVAQQLAVNEHTLAILVGQPPATFSVKQVKISAVPPVVPPGLPSSLLERRPDIQAAVNSIAAANARIGAARAGFFPDISLSAVGGYTSASLSHIFRSSNQTWAIGPLNGGTILTQPLFEGGLLFGTIDARKADYEAASANYRGAVLQAFREVEDQLSNLHYLSDQAASRTTATRASKRAYEVARQRYDVGYSSNLEFLDAQRSLLAAQRGEVQVLGQRYVATIQLIKALGGSWKTPPMAAKTTASTPPIVPPAAGEKPVVPATPAALDGFAAPATTTPVVTPTPSAK